MVYPTLAEQNKIMKQEHQHRALDPTKIGMTADVIETLENQSLMQTELPFSKLAVDQPLHAYDMVRHAYESQPHKRPPMPEAEQLPKLDVYSVTRYTGFRGLIRAIRSLPIETASLYATIHFNGGDDGTSKSVPNEHNAVVLPFHGLHKQSDTEHSKAA